MFSKYSKSSKCPIAEPGAGGGGRFCFAFPAGFSSSYDFFLSKIKGKAPPGLYPRPATDIPDVISWYFWRGLQQNNFFRL